MVLKPFVRETFSGDDAERLQRNIEPVLRLFNTLPFVDGVHIKKKTIDGATHIQHGLGRAPLGWFVTRLRGNSTVYDEQDGNTGALKTLQLNSSSAVEIDVWIF